MVYYSPTDPERVATDDHCRYRQHTGTLDASVKSSLNIDVSSRQIESTSSAPLPQTNLAPRSDPVVHLLH